jgi:hypothetical protein
LLEASPAASGFLHEKRTLQVLSIYLLAFFGFIFWGSEVK